MNEQNQQQTFTIPHMETIDKTAEIFGLPKHFVRTKVLSGEVVAVRAGKRYLVNVDKFAEYLSTNTLSSTQEQAISKSCVIHPIPVNL